jgi:hypothetical protein
LKSVVEVDVVLEMLRPPVKADAVPNEAIKRRRLQRLRTNIVVVVV